MAKSPNTNPGHRRGGAELWLLANHDFRQPAQTLAFLADQLTLSTNKADRLAIGASMALTGAALDAMIDAMTLVARYDTNRQRAAPVRTTLSEVLGPLIDELALVATNQGRRLDVAGLDLVIKADPDLLHAMTKGLVIYAIKFSDEGDIVVRGRSRRADVALDVSYAGPDPERALREKAFVELPPARSATTVPLIGYGPALVARLAEHAGIVLEPGFDARDRRRLSLLIPKTKKKRD